MKENLSIHHSFSIATGRKNHAILETARNMIKGKDLSNSFWAEALYTIIYTLSQLPAKALRPNWDAQGRVGQVPSVVRARVSCTIKMHKAKSLECCSSPSGSHWVPRFARARVGHLSAKLIECQELSSQLPSVESSERANYWELGTDCPNPSVVEWSMIGQEVRSNSRSQGRVLGK